MTGDAVREFWPVIVGIIGVIVWAVRVEAGMKKVEADVRGLWRQRHEDLDAAKASRAETNKVLEQIHSELKEQRSDIKTLLGRAPK